MPWTYFLHLVLDTNERRTRGLRFADSDGMPVEEEHVVDVTMRLIELELAHCARMCRGKVHVVAVLKRPAGFGERPIDARAGSGLRRV